MLTIPILVSPVAFDLCGCLFLGNKKEIKISGEIIYNFLNKFDKIFNKFSNIGTQKILVRNVKL